MEEGRLMIREEGGGGVDFGEGQNDGSVGVVYCWEWKMYETREWQGGGVAKEMTSNTKPE